MKEFNEKNDFSSLLNLFHSGEEKNIFIALNVLKHSSSINRSMFSLVLAVFEVFDSKEWNEIEIPEIKILAKEIILEYVSSSLWIDFRKLGMEPIYNQKEKKIGNLALEDLKKFNLNEIIIHKRLLTNSESEFIHFFINLNEDEGLPEIINKIKERSFSVILIKFIGQGDIIPVLNKITSFFKISNSLRLVYLGNKKLNLDLSKAGKISYSGVFLKLKNFYAKNKSNIQFPKVKVLTWENGGDFMLNFGTSFPRLHDLRIKDSKFDKFNISTIGKTLCHLGISSSEWKESANKEFGSLKNVEKLVINYCKLASIPLEFGQLDKLETARLMGNSFSDFPAFFDKLEKLEILFLNNNKIKSLPDKLDFPSLTYLSLAKNEIKNVDFLIQDSPKLEEIQLDENEITEITSEFINESLKKDILLNFLWNTEISLPSIDSINVPIHSSKAKFNFTFCYIDDVVQASYKKKYPNNFKF